MDCAVLGGLVGGLALVAQLAQQGDLFVGLCDDISLRVKEFLLILEDSSVLGTFFAVGVAFILRNLRNKGV